MPQIDAPTGTFRVIAMRLPRHATRAAETCALGSARDGISAAIATEARRPVLLAVPRVGGCIAISSRRIARRMRPHWLVAAVALTLMGSSAASWPP